MRHISLAATKSLYNNVSYLVTLLSIFSCNGIAIPLSANFPPSELRYILDDSESSVLLSSAKFMGKAEETIKEGLKARPFLGTVEKRLIGTSSRTSIQLVDSAETSGGMMLYTSGTTSRPVSRLCYDPI